MINDCLVGTGIVIGGTALISGIGAGLGAGAGAIGWSVLNKAGWTNVDFGYIEMVKANAVGSAILAVLPGLCIMATLGRGSAKEKVSSAASCGVITFALIGALSAMIGSAILGYLDEKINIGFSAAAGGAGNFILGAGVGVLCCIVACCVGGTFLCCRGASDEVIMAKVPQEYLNADGSIKPGSELAIENLEQVDPKSVVTASAWSFKWNNFTKMVTKLLGGTAPQEDPAFENTSLEYV